MKDLENPSSADEALFEPEPTGKSSVPSFTTEPKGKSAAAPEVLLFASEPNSDEADDFGVPLFAPEPKGESSADFELPGDFFEPIALPEEDGAAGDRLVREMWPEIPASDPSHNIPQAVVRRWADEREPLSPALRIALIVGTLMVVLLGGVVVWRVMLSRPRQAPTMAAAGPAAAPTAASLPPVGAAPVTAPSPDLARPAAPRVTAPVKAPVTPGATAAPPPAVPAPPVRVPATATMPPAAPAPTAAITPQPPRVVMPQPESQRNTGPAVAQPPLVGIPMPGATDPRPAVVVPAVVGSAVAPAAAATAPPAVSRPATAEPGPAPTAPVPSATRAPAATGLANGSVPVVADELRLRALMDRYRAAFAALDVDQARSVWPKVDARALSRAFGQLTSQSFDFSSCEVVVTGDRGSAGCSGNAEYVTKVGSRAPRTDARVWQFEFRRVGDQQWRIESVVTR